MNGSALLAATALAGTVAFGTAGIANADDANSHADHHTQQSCSGDGLDLLDCVNLDLLDLHHTDSTTTDNSGN